MILCDTHLHTEFSFDSTEPPQKILQRARELGIKHLAVTDHIDIGSYTNPKPIDLDKYFEVLTGLGKEYPDIGLSVGIEIGFTAQNAAENKAIIDSHNFDCVINSVHEVNGEDCYFVDYFNDKDQHRAYLDYFKLVRQSLDAPYYYSTVGHMGYVVRNAPYPRPIYDYADFKDILDDILLTVIQKNKILEINSSIAADRDLSIPTAQTLARYYDLGGRLISFGSDAHSTARLGDGYRRVAGIAKSIGFKHFTVVKNRQMQHLTI